MFEYRRCILTYCDILGFQSIISSNPNVHEIGSILRSLQTFSAPSENREYIFFTSFSDLVVRGRVLRSDGSEELACALALEAQDILFAQTEIANRRVLIRGAVTVGMLCVQSGVIFGPALIDAYRMERDLARFPRVIVADTVMAQIGYLLSPDCNLNSSLGHILRLDADGIGLPDLLYQRDG